MNRIFEEAHIGPLTLRNRTIRSAAFESMCPGHEPSDMLYDYHTSVARGGVGMTTVAYAAVTESGLSFDRQLVMKKEIVPGLRRLTDGIHHEGAAAGIQLGHCGNMSHRNICGCIPVGASTGSLENRMRFMTLCLKEVVKAAREDMAVVCKMNMRDGLKNGISLERHSIPIARRLQDLGVHAIVLSGGLVSATPMYVMRGELPLQTMTHYMTDPLLKYGIGCCKPLVRNLMTKPVHYEEAFFLEDALKFRQAMPDMKFIYVGGLVCGDKINEVLGHGFEAVQMARSLLNEPDFVNRLKEDPHHRCGCRHSNYCIGRMYTLEMACHQHLNEEIPAKVLKEIERIEREQNA